VTAPFQIFDRLPPATEAALRASIVRFGVLVPVVKDQHGRIIDGHHRSRIAQELKVDYRVDQVTVADDDEAAAMARTLNADRRHLTEEQRKEVVALLAAETVAVGREEVARYSPEAIAGALGVDRKTVAKDIEELGSDPTFKRPSRQIGQDGKVRQTRRDRSASQGEAPPTRRTTNRKALPDAARSAGWELNRAVEKVTRITADDRLAANAQQVATHLRHHLLRSIEALTEALNKLPETKENGT
jgi:ParB-like chromosome segregation protein Spo0J